MLTFEQRIDKLHEKIHDLESKIKIRDGNVPFQCACGEMHSFADCSLIITLTVDKGVGYEEDRDVESGWYISCTNKEILNKIWFNYDNNIPYEHRYKEEYNIEKQFKRRYRYVFKSRDELYTANWLTYKKNTDFETVYENYKIYHNEYIADNYKQFRLSKKKTVEVTY